MAAPVGRWRATYTPGDWIVLSGPSSLVVLEPPHPGWSSLVPTLWEEIVESASITEVAERLAQYRIDRMPSFGAFFWTADGMRSLIRGRVRAVDQATGDVVADGAGIQTWTENGLGHVERIRIDIDVEDDGAARGADFELPLVVGAVRASSVLLDASDAGLVFSPQVDADEIDGAAAGDNEEAGDDGDTEEDEAGLATQLADEPDTVDDSYGAVDDSAEVVNDSSDELDDSVDQFHDSSDEVIEDNVDAVGPDDDLGQDDEPATEPLDPDLDAIENGDTQLMVPPVAAAPVDPPAPTVALDPELLAAMEDGDTQLMMPSLSQPSRSGPDAGPPQPPAALSQDSLVMAVVCPYGHTSPQNATVCRLCGSPIAPQGPRLVPRPPLAVLRASNGATAAVDRAVLVGRAPSANKSTARSPRLLTVPSPAHDISRTHVEIAPEGWQVVVTDLRSTNGTVLVKPGAGDRQELPPGETVAVPLGSVIELGDGVSILIDFPQ